MKVVSKLILTFLILLSGYATAKKVATDPNIIVIISDDQGFADISIAGLNKDAHTPNIDRLARRGTRFTSAYVTAPICNVSRLALITGTYNQKQGAYWYGSKATINPKLTTIPELLKTKGYKSGYIGKFHYGFDDPKSRDFPLNHGFEYFYGYGGNGRQHFLIHNDSFDLEQRAKLKAYTERGGKHGQELEFGAFWDGLERDNRNGFSTEIYGSKAREFIKQNKGNKFYLQVAFNAVHNFTHQLPKNYLTANGLKGYHDWDPDTEDYYTWYQKSRYPNNPEGRKHYLAQLQYLDVEIGKIIDTLDEQGLTENTMIVFMSDNGGSTPIYADNGPLRGSKYTLYEGGIRIPMIVTWPGTFAQGVTLDNMVSTMDILPTIAKLTGAEVPAHVDGIDITRLLTGEDETVAHKTLFWDTGHETAIRTGRWKFKTATNDRSAKYEMVELELGQFLYDLDKDPGESTDVSKKYPHVFEQLSKAHTEWKKTINEGL